MAYRIKVASQACRRRMDSSPPPSERATGRPPEAAPLDLLGDAPPERYGAATALCLRDSDSSAVLALLAPQCGADPLASAKQLIEAAEAYPNKPVLACWMGETSVHKARELFAKHRLPSFLTPERAVEAFGYLAHFRRNQLLLLQTPGPLSDARKPDVEGARLIIEGVLASGRGLLTDTEAKALLTAFQIPTVTTIEVHSPTDALVAAESLGFPVALKVSCPELAHKSDVGGVLLNVNSAQEVQTGYRKLQERVRAHRPDAQIRAFTVESMAGSPASRELLLGVAQDPVFGPVIRFGTGGTGIEPLPDEAVALPPLNGVLARRLIGRTRAAALLEPFRQMPGVDRAAGEHALLRVSEMACELPHIRELLINPLLADEREVVAVDCRILVGRPRPGPIPYSHMAIHPYPSQLETHIHLPDGNELEIRPMRPEDAEIEQAFVRELSPESRYFRFMQSITELTPDMLVRITQPDYDRELALIALVRQDGRRRQIGVAHYAIDPDRESCEFALVVSDQWHQQGIGSRLMKQLFEAARHRGLKRIRGEVLAANQQMLALTRELGFSQRPSPEDPGVRIVERKL